MARNVIVVLIALSLVLWSCAGPADEAVRESGLPNILLIVAADLGYGDLGSCGQREIQTPNLDRLANEVVRPPPSTETDQVGAFWDLLPTFAEMADVGVSDDLDGQSLLNAFNGQPASDADRTLYWEIHEGQASKQAVRMGRWKGIRLTHSIKLEVYDLANDPGETLNLVDAFPEVTAKMVGYRAAARIENEAWPLRDAGDPPLAMAGR